MAEKSTLDNVIALAKRRGFVFQAGEIYGGSRSAWDYGPLGAELKENIRQQWWQRFVRSRADMVGLDSSVILPRAVWEASGHVATFTDPLVECLLPATSVCARITCWRTLRRRRAARPRAWMRLLARTVVLVASGLSRRTSPA